MRRKARTATQLGLLAALLVSLSMHGASVIVTLRSCAPRGEGQDLGPESAQPGIVESDLEVDGTEPASAGLPPHEEPEVPPTPPARAAARPAPRAPAPPRPQPLPDLPGPSATPTTDEGEAASSAAPVASAVAPTESREGPNSLGAQRRRLGGGAECTDPVAGIWKSSLYDVLRGQWYVFTLSIHRQDDRLTGNIVSKFWVGPRSSSKMPSSCAETSFFAQVSMPASGQVDGNRLRFGAQRVNVDRIFCGGGPVHYTPDRFSGRIDLAAHELQSLVTDGINLVDQPLLLRRVACLQ